MNTILILDSFKKPILLNCIDSPTHPTCIFWDEAYTDALILEPGMPGFIQVSALSR